MAMNAKNTDELYLRSVLARQRRLTGAEEERESPPFVWSGSG